MNLDRQMRETGRDIPQKYEFILSMDNYMADWRKKAWVTNAEWSSSNK